MDVEAYQSLVMWTSMFKNSDLLLTTYINMVNRMNRGYSMSMDLEKIPRSCESLPEEGDNKTADLTLETSFDENQNVNVNNNNSPTHNDDMEITPLDLSVKSLRKIEEPSAQKEKGECGFAYELGLQQTFPRNEDTNDVYGKTSHISPAEKVTKCNLSEHFKTTELRSQHESNETQHSVLHTVSSTRAEVNVHQVEAHRERRLNKHYPCHICGRSYRQARDFRAHLATHTDGSIFNCDICCRVLSTPSDYLQHLKTHRQKELMPCPHCGRYFRDSCTLSTHMRTHTGEKPYKCDICGRSFAQTGTYRRHRKGHERKLKF